MNFRTISDLNHLVYQNIERIPKDVDIVVGIPRSGMLVGSMIALYLNLPLTDFDSLLNGSIFESGRTKVKKGWISDISQARKILVVEDSSSTGKSLSDAKKRLESYQYKDKVIFLTAYVMEKTKGLTDIWFEQVEYPRLFEWNVLHHKRTDQMCFDIDGVLCVDPTPEENDDGEKYREFIRNAKPKLIPTNKVGYLVTTRLEKYRADTEYWLKKNNIQYGELIMMPYATMEERQKKGSHAVFKGKNYKKLKETILFVESEEWQAAEIAKVSGKTVFCTGNQMVYTENMLERKKGAIKAIIKKECQRKCVTN